MWTKEDEELLRQLTIDPASHLRDDLVKLVEHFRSGGTLYSVTDKGVPVHKSQEFARKLKELTQNGDLEWLLSSGDSTPPSRASVERTANQIEEHRQDLLQEVRRVKEVLNQDRKKSLTPTNFPVPSTGLQFKLNQALRQHANSSEAAGLMDNHDRDRAHLLLVRQRISGQLHGKIGDGPGIDPDTANWSDSILLELERLAWQRWESPDRWLYLEKNPSHRFLQSPKPGDLIRYDWIHDIPLTAKFVPYERAFKLMDFHRELWNFAKKTFIPELREALIDIYASADEVIEAIDGFLLAKWVPGHCEWCTENRV